MRPSALGGLYFWAHMGSPVVIQRARGPPSQARENPTSVSMLSGTLIPVGSENESSALRVLLLDVSSGHRPRRSMSAVFVLL